MDSEYTLNNQGDSIQPCPFPILNELFIPCLLLTVASWLSYRFLRRQVRWLVFPSLEFSMVCCDPYSQRPFHNQWGKRFSGILLFFLWSSGCWRFDLWFICFYKSSLYIWKFLVHILLKPCLKDFEHNLTSMWNEHNYMVVLKILWHCLSLGLAWKLTFSSPVTTAEFWKFADILSRTL